MPDSTATCRSCGRQIIWAISPDGKRIPIDFRPVTPYLYTIERAPGEMRARRAREQRGLFPSQDTQLHVSHFLTCPNASEHSRGRTPAAAGR